MILALILIFSLFGINKAKDFPIILQQDTGNITDKYLDCQTNTCTLDFVRFLFKKKFSITRNPDVPVGEIKYLKLYQAFFAAEDNTEGIFYIDLGDSDIEVIFEQSSILSKIIILKAKRLNSTLSVFNYIVSVFHGWEFMQFTDTEIRNLDSYCNLTTSQNILENIYRNFSEFNCSDEFSPYDLSGEYREEFIKNVTEDNNLKVKKST